MLTMARSEYIAQSHNDERLEMRESSQLMENGAAT